MMRLRRLLRATEVALFVSGLAALALWGWPDTGWGWFWLQGALMPLPASLGYELWLELRARRTVAQIKAHRRAKFGGFIREPGKRDVTPLDRPK